MKFKLAISLNVNILEKHERLYTWKKNYLLYLCLYDYNHPPANTNIQM
jgi:hypothetical protein